MNTINRGTLIIAMLALVFSTIAILEKHIFVDQDLRLLKNTADIRSKCERIVYEEMSFIEAEKLLKEDRSLVVRQGVDRPNGNPVLKISAGFKRRTPGLNGLIRFSNGKARSLMVYYMWKG